MLLRRLLLLASVLFVVAAIASAIAPRDESTSEAPAPAVPARPAPHASTRLLHGDMPPDKLVKANVGDVVELTVHAEAADEAAIPALGVQAPIDSDAPATLSIVADREGRFPVLLRWAGKQVGVLEVEAPK